MTHEDAIAAILAREQEKGVVTEAELRQQLADVTNELDVLRAGFSHQAKLLGEDAETIESLEGQLEASEARNAELSIYESFPCYLIDHCEGATVYEESLQHWLAEHIKALAQSAPATTNQCDGCQAGKPLENGNRHRMGREGGYPDFMSCTAKLYKPATDEQEAGS